jgi:hypothetical protein
MGAPFFFSHWLFCIFTSSVVCNFVVVLIILIIKYPKLLFLFAWTVERSV